MVSRSSQMASSFFEESSIGLATAEKLWSLMSLNIEILKVKKNGYF